MGVVYEAHDPALGRTSRSRPSRPRWPLPEQEREELREALPGRGAHRGRASPMPASWSSTTSGATPNRASSTSRSSYLRRAHAADEVAAAGRWRGGRRCASWAALADAAALRARAAASCTATSSPRTSCSSPSGEPKIMDFGIAKLRRRPAHVAGPVLRHAALHVARAGAGPAPWTDARTSSRWAPSPISCSPGRPPFEAPNVPGILARVAYQHPKPLRDLVPGLPADVEYVVTRAMAKNPADRFPDGKTMAEDVEDILAGRPPRHRDRWTPPPVGAGTVASAGGEVLPELSLDSPAERRAPAQTARPRRRRTLGLMLVLCAVAAAYFGLHPSDWQFWRRAVAEARRSRIGEEVRGWWGRVGVESPRCPPRPSRGPRRVPRWPRRRRSSPPPVTPPPVASPPVASPVAPPPSTLAEVVSIPEDDPDPSRSPSPAPAAKKGTRAAPVPRPRPAPPASS